MTTLMTEFADSSETAGQSQTAEQSQMAPRPYHWTVDAYYRAWDAGVFAPNARLELIQGRIIEQMPPSPLHASLTNIIADLLRTILSALTVRVEGAIHIETDGEPIPDVSVVLGANRDYLNRHPAPAEVILLIEVAISSAEYDLGAKSFVYAQAGIADYWVVLPNEKAIVVHREPTPDGYSQVARLGEDEAVRPLAASETSLSIRALLGR